VSATVGVGDQIRVLLERSTLPPEATVGDTIGRATMASQPTLQGDSAMAATMGSTGAGVGSPTATWTHVPAMRVRAAEAPAPPEEGPHDLALVGRLGEGGMGIVDRATQIALGREVAVKRLRSADVRGPRRESLLREASLTGRLEHPNIVPVHALGHDDHHGPVVVMKRIRGLPWSKRLSKDLGLPIEERLEHHLPIFMDVCQAIEFAHSQGVVHRDIKPDNVMVGDFGEVIVLDWGVAAALEELSGESSGVVGTPAYMPPELALGDSDQVDERSDVYLLGATLHEVVTGQPVRMARTIYDALVKAAQEAVEPPGPPCPIELAAIIAKACDANPAKRYSSVGALTEAVRGFIRRQPLERLLVGAREALKRLDDVVVPDDQAGRVEVYQNALQAHTEARFACAQAAEGWPEDDSAAEIAHRAGEVMARLEVALDHVDAAEALVARLTSPPADLVGAVQAARERADAEAAELEKRRRDEDLTTGQGLRFAFAVMMMLIAIGIEVFLAVTDTRNQVGSREMFFLAAGIAVIITGYLLYRRDDLLETRVDRHLGLVLVAWMIFFVLHRLFAWRADVAVSWIVTVDLLAFGIGFALMAPYLKAARFNVVLTLSAATGAALWPQHALSFFSVGASLAIAILIVDWGRRSTADEDDAAAPRS